MDKEIIHGIVEKAMAGDKAAFETLYRMFAKTILYHTRNSIHVESDVEDVAQEVVMQMFKGISTLKSPYAFSSWLHRIIINTCQNYNRKHVPRREREEALETSPEMYEEKESHLPEANAEKGDIRDRFLRSISELPPMQQTALTMYYYDEMSYKEIAKALGITTGTVSTNIKWAKEKLKTILENEIKKQGSDASVYGGIAIEPFIAEILKYDADKAVPTGDIEKFCSICDQKLKAYTGTHVASAKSASGLAKYCAAGAAVVVVGVATAVFYSPAQPPETTPVIAAPAAPETEEEAPAAKYLPDASINFTLADGSVGSINPKSANITINDGVGRVISWVITNADGENAASGEGDQVTDPLLSLEDGEYYIQWTLANAEDVPATYSARFFIE